MRVARSFVRVSFLVSIAVLAAACSSAAQKGSPDASLIPDGGIDSASDSASAGLDEGSVSPVDTAPPRLFAVSPESIDLGVLPLAALPAKPTITITAGRDIYYLSVSTTSGDLVLDGASTCKTKLAAGESCVVVIEITRSITGSVVVRADGEIATIPIAAVVRVPGKLVMTPTSVNLPGVGGGPPITINMGNVGGETVGPITVTVTGTYAEEFIATPTGCDFLTAGAVCAISVAYVPTTPIGPKNANLVATGPGPDLTTASAQLNAGPSGGPNPLVMTPVSQDFGSIAIGTTSSWVTFTVRNTSRTTGGPLAVAIDKTHFVVADDTCTGSVLGGGASGDAATAASCTFNLAFRPGALGPTWAVVSVSDSVRFSVVAQLTGTGVAPSTDASIAEPDADALDAGPASPLDAAQPDIDAASAVDAGPVD